MKILGKIFDLLQKPVSPEKDPLPTLSDYLIQTGKELAALKGDEGALLSNSFNDANAIIHQMLKEGMALAQNPEGNGGSLSEEEALLKICDEWRVKYKLPPMAREVTYTDGDVLMLFYKRHFRI